MKKYISAFLLFLMLLTACENVIEYDGDEQEPLLVLNCMTAAGSPSFVSVSHSKFFLGAEQMDVSLKDAVVTFEVNGKSATLAYDPEYDAYVDERILGEGDRVKVTAVHRDYGVVTAEDVVPKAHDLTFTTSTYPFVSATSTSLTDEVPGILEYAMLDSMWRVSLHIDDPENETNYYRMTLNVLGFGHFRPREDGGQWLFSFDGGGDESEPDENGMVECMYSTYFAMPTNTQFLLGIEDDELSELGLGMTLGSVYYSGDETFIFSDEYLHSSGSVSDIVFDVYLHTPAWWGEQKGWTDPDAHYISERYEDGVDKQIDFGTPWDYLDNHIFFVVNVTLETLTPATYYYLKSSDKFESTNWMLFSEPVQVYSNVKGGVGIFGVTSSQTQAVLVREYTFPLPKK